MSAWVEDFVIRIDKIVSDNNDLILSFNCKGNDVRQRSGDLALLDNYREVVEVIRRKGEITVLCSIVPCWGGDTEWLSRAIGVNRRLDKYWKEDAIPFIGNWDAFYAYSMARKGAPPISGRGGRDGWLGQLKGLWPGCL